LSFYSLSTRMASMDRLRKFIEITLMAYSLFCVADMSMDGALTDYVGIQTKRVKNKIEMMRTYDKERNYVIFDAITTVEDADNE
jgi:hypothetical protein